MRDLQISAEIEQIHRENLQFLEAQGFRGISRAGNDDLFIDPRKVRYALTHKEIEDTDGVYIKLYTDGAVSANVTLSDTQGYIDVRLDLPLGLEEKIEDTKNRIHDLNKLLAKELEKYLDKDTAIEAEYYSMQSSKTLTSKISVHGFTSAEKAYHKITENLQKLQDALK